MREEAGSPVAAGRNDKKKRTPLAKAVTEEGRTVAPIKTPARMDIVDTFALRSERSPSEDPARGESEGEFPRKSSNATMEVDPTVIRFRTPLI